MMPTCSWLSRLRAEKSWGSSVLLYSFGSPLNPATEMQERGRYWGYSRKGSGQIPTCFFFTNDGVRNSLRISNVWRAGFLYSPCRNWRELRMNTQKQTAFSITSTAGLAKLERAGVMTLWLATVTRFLWEHPNTARTKAFNQGAVNTFFDLLETMQGAKRFTPDRVYNVDETGLTTVSNRPSKIIASWGKETGWFTAVAERGQLVTVEICRDRAPPRQSQ